MNLFGFPFFEWVGYMASFVVLLSFMMKKMTLLRIVNTLGCALFVAYGFVLPSINIPIIITNVAIIIINIYYLTRKN